MNRLIEIANELKKLYNDRAGAGLYDYTVTKDLEARKLMITPAEGWPGKNAEQRDQARDFAYHADDVLKRIQVDLDANRVKTANLGAAIDGLEAERRALEWEIRGRLADALAGKRENHAPVEEAAFDESPLYQADKQLESMAVASAPGYSSTDDDLPF